MSSNIWGHDNIDDLSKCKSFVEETLKLSEKRTLFDIFWTFFSITGTTLYTRTQVSAMNKGRKYLTRSRSKTIGRWKYYPPNNQLEYFPCLRKRIPTIVDQWYGHLSWRRRFYRSEERTTGELSSPDFTLPSSSNFKRRTQGVPPHRETLGLRDLRTSSPNSTFLRV